MKHAPPTLQALFLGICGAVPAAAMDDCPPPSAAESGVETAVHVVFGPLAKDGDPGGIHALEHVAMNGPQVECAETWGLPVAAWTGPDTLHFVWRGIADEARIGAVVDQLQRAVIELDDGPEALAAVAAELKMERVLAPPSASMQLLQHVSAPNTRYARPLQAQASLHVSSSESLARAGAELQAAPVTVVVAQAGSPVRWRSSLGPTAAPVAITQVERPPWTDEAWSVEGTLDCTQRRAVWALVHGRAEVLGGTATGWLGRDGGVVGIADASQTRAAPRRVVLAAQRWDLAAVRNTHRRARDLVDQSWMAVGHVGLGVCPSVDPLPIEALRSAQGWLKGSTRVPAGALSPSEGALVLPHVAWGAVWQAGLPPDGWDEELDLFHTRTPGGYTVDGPVAVLSEHSAPRPAESLVPLHNPVEQALVLSGALSVVVGAVGVGVDAPSAEGALRVPMHNTVLVVDTNAIGEFVQLDAVFANEGNADLWAPGSSVRAPLDTDGRVRDTKVQSEGPRVRISASLPLDSVSTVVESLVHPDIPPTPGTPDAHRSQARPWEAVRVGPPSSRHGELGAYVVVLHGPAEAILAALDAISVHADRVLTPAQLEAEATAIR